MNKLTFDGNGFYLGGKPFRIIAGDIHYFRIHPDRWEHTLDFAVDFGLNAIQTYVPWNAHEYEPGKFDFTGMLNIGKFLELCGKKGLKVLLRPSPYICSEWDFGGMPSWLLRDRNMILRSEDPRFLAEVARYYKRLIPEFLPYLSTSGGPIIAVAVENEYGGYGCNHEYLRAIADMLTDGGVDVPLYTTDGDDEKMQSFGRYDDNLFFGLNLRAQPNAAQHAMETQRRIDENKPLFLGEYWAGRSMHWGEPFRRRVPMDTAIAFKEALERNGNVCFYMFAGGTNFGFMGGANNGFSYTPRPDTTARYIPHTTSYDVDALLGANGYPNEKYYLCRDVLDAYLGKAKRIQRYAQPKNQSITIKLTETASLFDNLDPLTDKTAHSIIPKPMEDYGQRYGFILYSTTLRDFGQLSVNVKPYKYRDRASVYVDGKRLASFTRDRQPKIADGVEVSDGLPLLSSNGHARKIDVLVENLGRANFGKEITDERKGMEDGILISNAKLYHYETRTLPLNDLSGLAWTKNSAKDDLPYFYRGSFSAQSGVDTYVDFSKFGHGYVWINGFNLGRYDSAGPQLTLFVPGEILRDEDNTIIVLDVFAKADNTSIELIDEEILEGDAEEL